MTKDNFPGKKSVGLLLDPDKTTEPGLINILEIASGCKADYILAGGSLTFNLVQDVAPGEFADISVPFTAPTTPGTYSSYWKLLSADGYYFGDVVSVNISVGVPTATVPPPTATTKPTKTLTATEEVTPTEETPIP